jgi:hypothetical protein
MLRGYLANNLTLFSNHYLDWSRVGELLVTGSQRYTSQKLLSRGSIFIFLGMSSCLGAYLNNSEKSGYSDMSVVLATAFLGFSFSHTIAITPLIYKRYQVNQECNQLIDEIKKLLVEKDELFTDSILQSISDIQTLSLSDDIHSRASQTWGSRKRLLIELKDEVMSNTPGETITKGV